MPELTYLYAIVPQAGRPSALHVSHSGMEDMPLEALEVDGLCAILSGVPDAEWGPDVLDLHVQDMDWLAPRAMRHQALLAELHAAAPSLLPLPFATLYRQRTTIHDLLQTRRNDLLATLARLAGADEWTLKLFQDRAAFAGHVERLSPVLAQAVEQTRTAAPGKAYLLRKQLETLRRDEAARMTAAQADEIEEQIRAVSGEVIREPIAAQPAAASARDVPEGTRAVLKLTLLLPRQGRDERMAHIEEIAGRYTPQGYQFELTGPWPPYSFASMTEEGRHG